MTDITTFFDRTPIKGFKKTRDGFLLADVKVARTGVQTYLGRELGRPHLDRVTVYRPEEEVFSDESIATYVNRTVTDDHPTEMVNAKNWKKTSVGATGGKVLRDGEFVTLPMMVLDAAAVSKIEAGKRELSCGYDAELVWEDGLTPDGVPYQAKQRNIRVNHVAIVDAGRAGSECRIRDAASVEKEGRRMTDKTLRTVMFDGLSIETTDQGAQAIEKLQSQLQATKDGHATVIADLQKQIADRDAQLGVKDGEIKKLQDAAIKPEQMDRMIADRADLVSKVKALDAAFDCTGKSPADIRRAVVSAKMGDAKIKDKSDDYVAALFDTLASAPGSTIVSHNDTVRHALANHGSAPVPTTDKMVVDAHAEYVKSLQDGWKTPAPAAAAAR